MSGKRVIWNADELQAVIAEALRLRAAGKAKKAEQAFELAQRVLPKDRRREVDHPYKLKHSAPKFMEAWVRAEVGALEQQVQQRQENQQQQGASAKKPRVHWNADEKSALCREAARLISNLEAGSRREALMKAQNVLPPERRRDISTMTSVDDWFPAGLTAAMDNLRREPQEAAKAPELVAEPVAAQDTPADTPELVIAHGETSPFTAAPPMLAPQTTHSFMGGMLGTPWAMLREHLIQEIAGIVSEGIRRGIESVQLAQPQTTDTSEMPRPHVPFVRDGQPKERRPSVLVVGLKEACAAQIQADFGKALDLRFCTPSQSKDHLRQMTERVDTTVGVVDFLSHSHTDIMKARSRSYVESRGGLTHLRQELSKLVPANGHEVTQSL